MKILWAFFYIFISTKINDSKGKLYYDGHDPGNVIIMVTKAVHLVYKMYSMMFYIYIC